MSEPVSVLDRARIESRPGLVLEDCGPLGMVSLKGDLAAAAIAASVDRIAGTPVPAPLSTVLGPDGVRVVWMAPDELLFLTADYHAASAIETGERVGLAGEHATVLNLTGARAVFRLAGPDAAETLAKGAPLDFADAAFPVARARRTHLGGIAAAIWRCDAHLYEVVCSRSYGQHLFDWLAVSGAEGAEVGAF